jgi:hypothetical protein
MKRKIRKLLFQMKYLEEDLEECQAVYDQAKIDLENEIRKLHYDLNVHDDAIDGARTKKSSDKLDHNNLPLEESDNKKKPHPSWAKKLFRDIVKETHPDHFPKGMRNSRKKNLTEIYEKTVKKYKENSYADLIDSAIKLGIDIGEVSEDHVSATSLKIKSLVSQIDKIKNSIYWHWAHGNEDQKMSILKKFVEMRSWTSSKASRSKAKSGKRKHPGKSISWARKKFKNVSDIPSHEEE